MGAYKVLYSICIGISLWLELPDVTICDKARVLSVVLLKMWNLSEFFFGAIFSLDLRFVLGICVHRDTHALHSD